MLSKVLQRTLTQLWKCCRGRLTSWAFTVNDRWSVLWQSFYYFVKMKWLLCSSVDVPWCAFSQNHTSHRQDKPGFELQLPTFTGLQKVSTDVYHFNVPYGGNKLPPKPRRMFNPQGLIKMLLLCWYCLCIPENNPENASHGNNKTVRYSMILKYLQDN